jgi:hypothetical protein
VIHCDLPNPCYSLPGPSPPDPETHQIDTDPCHTLVIRTVVVVVVGLVDGVVVVVVVVAIQVLSPLSVTVHRVSQK